MTTTVTETDESFYVTGGTLPPDARSYIARNADDALVNALLAGETCYVLNSRQMGKSSLCVRAMGRLQEAGTRTVFLDLTKFGSSNPTVEQWYAALLNEIGRELDCRAALFAYWKANDALPFVQRVFGALADIALPAAPSSIVVFVDEIDITRTLPFETDEFFAAIRQCVVGRATEAKLKRLAFCLLGTAAPQDLIQNTAITPFNVGKRVEVTDFTPQEAAPLAKGLNHRGHGEHGGSGEKLLQRVLFWTNGHPYLTQRLCSAIREAQTSTPNREYQPPDVDSLCHSLFLSHAATESDDNLANVRNRLLNNTTDRASLLTLYGKIREDKRVPDDETNPLCALIKLSGVAKMENGLLRVRNRIYATVFDAKWVTTHMPDAELRRQKEAYRKGVTRTGVWAGAIVTLFVCLAAFAFSKANEARKQTQIALIEKDRADTNLYNANMNLIQREWDNNNVGRVLELLEATRKNRVSGFEWGYWNRLCHLDVVTLKRHAEVVNAVCYSPDGKWLVTGSGDNTAKVWDAQTGQEIRTLKGHAGGVSAVCYSPDGNRIVTGNRNNKVWVWNAQTGQVILPLYGTGNVNAVCYSPDGKRIVTGSGDHTAKVWDAQTGQEILPLFGHTGGILSVGYSPNGKRIVTGSVDNTAKVWNAQTGQEIHTLKGHAGGVSAVCYSPDGKRIVTGSVDNTAKVWDARTWQESLPLYRHQNNVSSVCYSPDVEKVVTGSWDSTAQVWDAQTGKEILTLKGHTGGILSVCYSPDGKRIVTGSGDHTAKIWDAQTGQESLTLKGHTRAVNAVCYSPDGKRIVTGSWDNTAKVWDAQTGQEILTLKGHIRGVLSVCYSPDGNRIVTGSGDNTAKVWISNPEAK